MKSLKIIGVIVGVGMAQSLVSDARDLYQLSWKGTKYTTNAAGKVVASPYSEKEIIAKCAADNGITDLKSLAYVYVANEKDTEVVFATTGATVCEVFQLENSFTEVPSADGTTVARQSFVFNETHGQALGSAFGLERSKRNMNGDLVTYSYRGNFQFSIPEDNTVYSGTFTTSKRLKDTASP
jgi:hypothetical protein